MLPIMKIFVGLAFTICWISMIECQSCTICLSGDLIKSGTRYHLQSYAVNWFEAFRSCAAQGMQLATINNQQDMDLITKLVKDNNVKWAWIGATDLGSEGHFGWFPTGKPLAYRNWASGQPDNLNDEDCVHLTDRNGVTCFNDWICTGDLPFVCEELLF